MKKHYCISFILLYNFIFSFLFLHPLNISGQIANDKLMFIKTVNQKRLTVKIPAHCSIFSSDHQIYTGTINKIKDTLIFLQYLDIDTLKINSIVNDKSLRKKQRTLLIDSIYKSDTVTVVINVINIERFSFMTASIKEFRYKIPIIAAFTGQLVTSVLFLASMGKSPKDRTTFDKINAGLFGISLPVVLILGSLPKEINMDEWRISPE